MCTCPAPFFMLHRCDWCGQCRHPTMHFTSAGDSRSSGGEKVWTLKRKLQKFTSPSLAVCTGPTWSELELLQQNTCVPGAVHLSNQRRCCSAGGPCRFSGVSSCDWGEQLSLLTTWSKGFGPKAPTIGSHFNYWTLLQRFVVVSRVSKDLLGPPDLKCSGS